MSRPPRRLILLLLALAAFTASADRLPEPTPIAYRERLLGNGLTVISIENHASPTVAVQVWYRVGSKDDPPGRSGFAHLFEHLMFKRTKHLADEQFDRLTEDVGGENNASTRDDCTNYLDVVPAHHLERLLWAEAERMQHLRVDEAAFRSERAVVQEEFRSSILTPPYGRLFHLLQQESWQAHPYRRPTIGSIEDLDAATLADVQAFHARWYRPDNAALIVAGDFEPARLDAWVDRHFGAIARPSTPLQRLSVVEPLREVDRRVTARLPNVPLPALAISWLAPPPSHPDAAALRVAETLLADGESSRLGQALIHRRQAVQEIDFGYDETVDRGSLYAVAILASGRRLATVEQALLAEIERLARQPLPTAELDKAKALLVTATLEARESNADRALALGEAWIRTGSPAAANAHLASLIAVSADDVQRAVRTHLIEGRRVTLEYLPASGAAR